MQVWAVIAQKGGQSKTTLSTGFAVEAAREGASVVILDADDRQGSALYWSERRDMDDVMVKDSSVAGLPLHVSRACQRQDRPHHHRHAGELERHCHARGRAG
jgi:chromosome partitioning protein